MSDPYAGLGAPVEGDPYAGLGKPIMQQGLASKAGDAAKLVARGATSEGFYFGLEGLSQLASQLPQFAASTINALEELRDAGSNRSPHEQIARAEQRKARFDERLKDLDTEAPAAMKALAGARWYAAAVRDTRDKIKAGLPVAPESEQALWGQVAQGVGQAVGTLPTFAIPGFGPAQAVGQLYQQGYEDAKQHGADETTAHNAGVKNIPAAALEYLGDKVLLGRVLKPLKGKLTVRELLKGMAISAATEGATEAGQQAWQNYVASSLSGFDPDRTLDDGVVNAAIVGATVGGLVGTTGPLLSEGMRRLDERADTGMNKPELPADLQAQQRQLERGDRAVQMFPLGTDELPLPEGMQRVETTRGVFHYDPRRMTADEVLSASKAGRENELLGLGPYSKPEVMQRHAAGEPLATMVERGPNGEELRAAVVTPSTAPETRATMEAGKSAGSTVKLERLPETLARRELADEIESSLPDAESKDYVRGRNAQDVIARAKETTDLPALWKETVESVVTSGATPAQIRAIHSTLGVLTDAKARKEAGLRGLKISRERIANVLAGTAMDGALRGSTFAKLTDALARKPENIAALRAEFAATLDEAASPSAQPASSLRAEPGATTATATPAPAALTTLLDELERLKKPMKSFNEVAMSIREGRIADIQRQLDRQFPDWRSQQPTRPEDARAKLREQIAAEATLERKRSAELEQKKAVAQKALAEASTKREAEAKRLAHIDRTGRDPESGLIVDLRKVPAAELENFDWDKDRYMQGGDEVRPEDIEAVLMRRAREEERAAAGAAAGGYTLGGLLRGKPADLAAAGMKKPLRLLSPKEARERGSLGGEHAALRERTGGFAYFARDGLVEDQLEEKLRELGFDVPDVQAAYALVERAMNGEEVTPLRNDGGSVNPQFSRRGEPGENRNVVAAIEAKLERGAVDRDVAARAVNRFIDVQDGTGKWPTRMVTKKRVQADGRARLSTELEPQTITEEEARALNAAVREFDAGTGRFQWPSDDLHQRLAIFFARRQSRDPVQIEQLANRWWKNLESIAPGLAKEAELRIGQTDTLVEAGLAQRDEITGQEEAARVRDHKARREIFYLFEQALRRNTTDITRLNLLHEMGHAFWDTLDRETQVRMLDHWQEEISLKRGPLFDASGELRDNVALGVQEDFQEWFAERLAHANDAWAKRRIEATPKGESLFATIAAQFRALLLRMREFVSRHLELDGYDDGLLTDFRQFLDQGTRWDIEEPPVASFVRRGIELTPELAAKTVPVVTAQHLPGTNAKELRLAAREAAAEWLGEPIRNADTGAEIVVTGKSLSHGFSHQGLAHIRAVPALPELIRTAVHVTTEPHSPASEHFVAVHRYAGAVDIDSRRYRVKLTVKERPSGQLLYDHEATQIETPAGNLRARPEESVGTQPSAGATLTIGELFGGVKPGTKVHFARRDAQSSEFEAALREFDRLERERDAIVEGVGKVPRELLVQLSEARITLENTWPGWRELRAERQAEEEANAIQPPEPEMGVSAVDDTGREVRPEVTRAKISALMASHYRPVGALRTWVENIGRLFVNFRSAIPELPGGAKGREFVRFRQGFRMLKAATEAVRRQAEERVAHIVQPIIDLPGDTVAANDYRRMVNLQAAIKSLEEKAETPADYLKVSPQIRKLSAELDALETKLETLPYHLFRKIVLLRDLWFRGKLLNLSGEPITLPLNLTREGVEQDLRRLHQKLAESPHRDAIEQALKRHYALVRATRDDLLSRGYVIPEELRNPLYFPHLILDKFSGRLQRVRMDTAEDFRGYLQQLTGSAKDIETDYLTAMYYHMGQVLAHNARQDIVATYWQPYDIKPQLEEEVAQINAEREEKGLGPLVWQQLVPKDHAVYTVDDRIPLRPEYTINRRVLAERLGVELGDGDLQAQLRDLGLNVTITAEDVRQAMAAGEKQIWVLPREVAAALDGIIERETRSRDQLRRALALPQSAWKWWKLFSPTSVIRYTYGNLVGDLEKLFSVDPKVFSYLLPAYREVRAFAAGGKASADLREAFRRGVLQSPTAAETGDLVRAGRFEAFLSSREKLMNNIARGVQWGQYVNGLRESAFRYAKFKADLDRMRRGERPVYAGAYGPDVEAITGDDAHFAKAAEIARKTFVDYEAISVSGDALRRYWVPFYSWAEGNFRYHANLFRNLADMSMGAGAAQIARGSLVGASKAVLPRSVTGVLLRLALPYVAVGLWNASGDREEIEKDLSEEDRRRFHIVLGRDEKGQAIVVYAPTALADVMEWFGGNEFARLAMEYNSGRITLPQFVHEWLANTPRQTLNKAAQGTNPFFKTLLEFVSRKGYFPDITDARSIPDYDMGWHVLANMTDIATADTVRRLVDEDHYSSRSVGEWIQQLILQARRRDPEQWGYYATLDRVAEWKFTHGRGSYEPGADNREEAELLRSFRRALRSADVGAAIVFYHKLLGAGYTSERFAKSVRAGDPLATMRREDRQAFVDTLNPAERHDLQSAYRYWQRLEVFRGREAQLFPSEKASPAYRERFNQSPRNDVLAELVETAEGRSEEEEELRAERLLKLSVLPR